LAPKPNWCSEISGKEMGIMEESQSSSCSLTCWIWWKPKTHQFTDPKIYCKLHKLWPVLWSNKVAVVRESAKVLQLQTNDRLVVQHSICNPSTQLLWQKIIPGEMMNSLF
jgi:hypothetical protein